MASSAFDSNSTAEEVLYFLKPNLIGKNVIVTGANTGIGKETARVLALANANVYGDIISLEVSA